MTEYHWIIDGDVSSSMNRESKPVEGEVVSINGNSYEIVDVDYAGSGEYNVTVERR